MIRHAAVVVSALLLSGCCCNAKPSGGGSTASVPAMSVDLSTLLAAYKGNEVGADQTYKGKVIVVSGTVNEIKKDIMDQPYVILTPHGEQFLVPSVQCTMAHGSTAAATLKKGAHLTVKGTVDGLMMNVLLSDCAPR